MGDKSRYSAADTPSQVLPWLFVGTRWHASQLDWLAKDKVKNVLNVVGGSYPSSFTKENYLMHPMCDYGTNELSVDIDICFKFLDTVKKRKEKVLVHCQMGSNRSPTVVIAYLVKVEGWPLRQALLHVKKCRPRAHPHERYLKQLVKLEVAWRGKGSITQEEMEEIYPSFSKLMSQFLRSCQTQETGVTPGNEDD